MIEVVALLTYLGGVLDYSDDDWPAVRSNIGKARQFWLILGVILRQYGGYHITSVEFYRVVVHAVLLSRA